MSVDASGGMGEWVRMLASKPVRNTAVRVVENDKNGITVYVKQKRPGFLVPPLSWIVPFSPEKRVVLDSLGVRIWKLCDGKRTVEQIIDAFRTPYGLTFHEGRAAVVGYLKQLIKRGVLAIIMQEES